MFTRLALLSLGILALLTACTSKVETRSVASDPQILRGNWQGEFFERCVQSQNFPSWNTDSTTLFTFSGGPVRAQIWNASTGKALRAIPLEGLYFRGGAVSNDVLAVVLYDTLKTFRVSDGQERSSAQISPYGLDPIFDASHERVLINRLGGFGFADIELLEVSSGKTIQKFTVKTDGFDYPTLSPDGRQVAVSSSYDTAGKLEVWNVGEEKPFLSLPVKANQIVFTGAGRYIAAVTPEAVRVWRVSDGKEVLNIKKANKLEVLLLPSSQAKLGLSLGFYRYGSRDGLPFELYNLENGQKERALTPSSAKPYTVIALSPDGTRLLAQYRSPCELEVLNLQGQSEAGLDLPRLETKSIRVSATASFLSENEYGVGGTATLDGQIYAVSGKVSGGCSTLFRTITPDSETCKNRGLFPPPDPMQAQLELSKDGKTFGLDMRKYREVTYYNGESNLGTDKTYDLLLTRANP